MQGGLRGAYFGQWQLAEMVGIGGTAEIYRATRPDSPHPAAIKVMRPELVDDKERTRAFHKEIALLRELRHPGFPRFFAEGEIKGRPCFSMQFIAGPTLRQMLDQEVVFDRVGALLGATTLVSHLHGQKIVHGDVKLENFLLPGDGHLRLIDFGNARRAYFFRRQGGSGVQGTPSYVAPELIKGKAASMASDVYALGVLAWYLLADRAPFVGGKTEILRQAAQCQAPGIRQTQPLVPLSLVRIIDRAVSREPDARFGNAEEMLLSIKVHFRQPEVQAPADLTRALLAAKAKAKTAAQGDDDIDWMG